MNRADKKQAEIIRLHHAAGNSHAVAAGLSALIRAAMSAKTKREWIALAEELGATSHPEFIV